MIGYNPVYPQTTYVPLNHWIYGYLERLEAKQVLQGVLNGTKPLSRSELADYLAQVHQKVEQGYSLNKVELDQLNFLNIEFQEELNQRIDHLKSYQTRRHRILNNRYLKKFVPGWLYQNDRNFFSWQQDQFQVFIDPILNYKRTVNQTDSLTYAEQVNEFSNGARAWGSLGKRLGFFIDVRDTKEWGTRKYPDQHLVTYEGLGFVNGYGSHIYHDETIAYLTFGLSNVTVQYGKDLNKWGPGARGSLVLSDHATSYDLIKLQLKIWKLKFTSIYGFLQPYPRLFEGKSKLTKSLAGHRLEMHLFKWLDLGGHETVIFGRRQFEPGYLNPIMFYRSAEHYLGSKDNATIGMDVELFPVRNLKIYGELFIDDLTTTKLGTDWFGNKLGYLTGLYHIDVMGLPNLDFRIEYVRLRPYVYSHIDSLTIYKHFNTILGHEIGPNADDLYWSLQYQPSKGTTVSGFYEFRRHGANNDKNIGGNVDLPYRENVDANYVSFLEGIQERWNTIGIDFSYEIFREFYFRIQYFQEQFKKEGDKINSDVFLISLALNF